jgi:dTDP-4-dehydrorhamnose 3,5-epimerase-like enzyme
MSEACWIAIADVTIRRLEAISDIRGSLCEIHRDAWALAPKPVQWDLVTSKSGVLRGMHVHCLRWDYIVIADGHATIGLVDMRNDGDHAAGKMMIDVSDRQPTLITIPPGVLHGILANTELIYLYGLTVAWDGSDEDLGCRYDDRTLALPWPCIEPTVLARDAELPDFASLARHFAERMRVASNVACS